MSQTSTTPPSAAPRVADFQGLGLSRELAECLRSRGITSPLPIQSMALPDALAGRDVSGRAPTGSGKTLAFALPMAASIHKAKPRRPTGLVLAPTRELASQIAAELVPLAKIRGLRVHAFYGGVGYGPQFTALARGVDIVVACPGRLEDLMGSGHVVLADVEVAVVDEADRMADMGFLPAVRRILDTTSAKRQTLLFSATLDGDVDVLVRDYQHDPIRHEAAADVDASEATHRFHYVERDARVGLCGQLISASGSTIVFVRTRHGADRLARQLSKSGVAAAAIHGDRSQSQRERALRAFSSGSVQALVATDVAARGIHVDEVACVIHYDLPPDPKDYVHRSGRTARAGAAGTVVALVTPEDHVAADTLRSSLRLDPELDGTPPARKVARAVPSDRRHGPRVQAHRPTRRSQAAPRRRRGSS